MGLTKGEARQGLIDKWYAMIDSHQPIKLGQVLEYIDQIETADDVLDEAIKAINGMSDCTDTCGELAVIQQSCRLLRGLKTKKGDHIICMGREGCCCPECMKPEKEETYAVPIRRRSDTEIITRLLLEWSMFKREIEATIAKMKPKRKKPRKKGGKGC